MSSMKKDIEEIIFDIPLFYEEIPIEKAVSEIIKRNGETVLLADEDNFAKSFFLCQIRIDPKDKTWYFVRMLLDNSKKAWEMRLKYENLIGLKVKAEYSPHIYSEKYKMLSK